MIIAIAGELLADGGVFMFGSHLQTIADAELAQASKDAALAIQQAAASNKEAANARLETARLEKQLSPRFIADQPGMATNLSKYEGTRAVIFCDTESRSLGLGSEILTVLQWAHWKVDFIPTSVIPSGVRIGKSPPYGAAGWVNVDEVKTLLAELKRSAIESSPFATIDRAATFRGIVIEVGPKPSIEEAELIDLENKVFDPRLNHLSGHEELYNKYLGY